MTHTHQPRYLHVKNYILDGIRAGHWLPEQKTPSENELTTLCSVSRMTARRALDELTSEGILNRIQGLGTFVSQPSASSSLLEIRDIADEIQLRGHKHRSQLLQLDEREIKFQFVPEPIRNIATDCFYSEILHFENDLPIQLEQRFINPVLIPEYLVQNFQLQNPSKYLLQITPVTRAEQRVEAIISSEVISELLSIKQSIPCLVLHRITWSGDKWVSINTFYHPGNRYQFESDISF